MKMTSPHNKYVSYLESAPAPGKACSQHVSMGNNDKRQKDSQRQQPNERPSSAITAVAVVTG